MAWDNFFIQCYINKTDLTWKCLTVYPKEEPLPYCLLHVSWEQECLLSCSLLQCFSLQFNHVISLKGLLFLSQGGGNTSPENNSTLPSAGAVVKHSALVCHIKQNSLSVNLIRWTLQLTDHRLRSQVWFNTLQQLLKKQTILSQTL